MAGIFGRLDRLVDRMIETETLLPRPGRLKLPTLKPIFENLRYYTVLAFLWYGVRVLRDDGGWLASAGGAVLAVTVFVLGLLTAMQTTTIVLATAVGVTSALMPPRTVVRLRKRLRESDAALKWFALPLTAVVVAIAATVGAGLFGALARAGLM